MKLKRRTHSNAMPARWYRGADVPMRVIRRFARQVAKGFSPDKIILFGSFAYGRPHADSDVDILVIGLANGGQNALLSARSTACFASLRRPQTDRGGHTRTQPWWSGRLFAKTATANWRRTAAKGGQNG